MRVTVLGATGYIGSHVAEQLSLAGFTVVCLVREGSSASFLKQLAVDIQCVDYSDDDQLLSILSGSDVVCNCIADTRQHIRIEEHRKIEVELSSRLFALCEKAGVKRFLQLSTVMVYGFKRPDHAIDENYETFGQYSYNQIAIEREETLLKLAEKSSMNLLMLRPANAMGKRDASFMPNFISAANWNMFPSVGGGLSQFSCVDCRDIGRAFVHLIDVPVSKAEIYLLKSFDLSWLDLKSALEQALGKQLKLFSMNRALFMFIARVMEFVYPYGTEPSLTRFSLEVLSKNTLFDTKKLAETGFKPKYSLAESIQDCL